MNDSWVWVHNVDIYLRPHISHRDFLPNEHRYDELRQGYWVKKDSQTLSILILKGIEPEPQLTIQLMTQYER